MYEKLFISIPKKLKLEIFLHMFLTELPLPAMAVCKKVPNGIFWTSNETWMSCQGKIQKKKVCLNVKSGLKVAFTCRQTYYLYACIAKIIFYTYSTGYKKFNMKMGKTFHISAITELESYKVYRSPMINLEHKYSLSRSSLVVIASVDIDYQYPIFCV